MPKRMIPLFVLLLCIAIISSIAININVQVANAQTFGTNPWTSQFYNDTGFGSAIAGASPSYNALNFNWGAGSPTDANGVPVTGVPADNFSAVFTSTQTINAGTYTFTVTADDRARLLVNNVEVINITVPGTQQAQAVMPGGQVILRVEYVEVNQDAYLQVQWAPVGTVVDPNLLLGTPVATLMPTATPLPYIAPGSMTATVISARVLNVRNVPSSGGIVVGKILRGQTYAVIGRDDNAEWFLLQFSGFRGWSYGYYLYINGNEFNAPVVSGNTLLNLAGIPDLGVRAQVLGGMRLRDAPSLAGEQIGRLPWGVFVPVIGRSANGAWYQIVWWDTIGWVFSPYLRIVEGSIWNVPVAE